MSLFKEQMPEQKNLVADFSKVDYISSAGLRVLLATLKETRRIGGDLRLANVQEFVNKVLKISGFVSILKIFPDTDSAIESFTEQIVWIKILFVLIVPFTELKKGKNGEVKQRSQIKHTSKSRSRCWPWGNKGNGQYCSL